MNKNIQGGNKSHLYRANCLPAFLGWVAGEDSSASSDVERHSLFAEFLFSGSKPLL